MTGRFITFEGIDAEPVPSLPVVMLPLYARPWRNSRLSIESLRSFISSEPELATTTPCKL